MEFNIFTHIYTEKELLSYLSIETNICNIKKELVGYNSNFFLNSEEITDEERLQITNLSVESLINCSNSFCSVLYIQCGHHLLLQVISFNGQSGKFNNIPLFSKNRIKTQKL